MNTKNILYSFFLVLHVNMQGIVDYVPVRQTKASKFRRENALKKLNEFKYPEKKTPFKVSGSLSSEGSSRLSKGLDSSFSSEGLGSLSSEGSSRLSEGRPDSSFSSEESGSSSSRDSSPLSEGRPDSSFSSSVPLKDDTSVESRPIVWDKSFENDNFHLPKIKYRRDKTPFFWNEKPFDKNVTVPKIGVEDTKSSNPQIGWNRDFKDDNSSKVFSKKPRESVVSKRRLDRLNVLQKEYDLKIANMQNLAKQIKEERIQRANEALGQETDKSLNSMNSSIDSIPNIQVMNVGDSKQARLKRIEAALRKAGQEADMIEKAGQKSDMIENEDDKVLNLSADFTDHPW